MSLPPIYAITKKYTPVPGEEIDSLEEAMGSLPRGYREFMSKYGPGQLCDHLWVGPPSYVLSKAQLDSYLYIEMGKLSWAKIKPLKQSDLGTLWDLGSDENGNNLVYCARFANAVFQVPHGSDRFVQFRNGFDDLHKILGYQGKPHPFVTYLPQGAARKVFSFRVDRVGGAPSMSLAEVIAWIKDYWKDRGDVIVQRLPPSYGNSTAFYIPEISGQITLAQEQDVDPFDDARDIYGGMSIDQDFNADMKSFRKAFTKFVKSPRNLGVESDVPRKSKSKKATTKTSKTPAKRKSVKKKAVPSRSPQKKKGARKPRR